jgi:hypothetical protein
MNTENISKNSGSSVHGFLMDKDLGIPIFDDSLGRIPSDYMYATNTPDINCKSGIWEFLVAMDNTESLNVLKDHTVFLESKENANRSMQRSVVIGSGVAFLVAIPLTFLRGSMTGLIAGSAISSVNSGLGAYNAYAATKKVSRDLESSRLNRLSEKIELMRRMFNVFKNDNRKQDMRDLVKVRKYFSYAMKKVQ